MKPESQLEMTSEQVLSLLASRRVCRAFSESPVADGDLVTVLEAARWGPSAGNNRIQRFLVVRDTERIRLVESLAPGVLATPPVMIAICTDLEIAERRGVRVDLHASVFIDVGTAAMSMMVQAHGLGLGTCPVRAFSQGGVRTVLDLPPQARPELLLLVGHPARPNAGLPRRRGPSPKLRELAFWGRYHQPLPESLLHPSQGPCAR